MLRNDNITVTTLLLKIKKIKINLTRSNALAKRFQQNIEKCVNILWY